MERALIWAGAALQVVLFQTLIWALLAGSRQLALWLLVAVFGVAVCLLVLVRRNVSTR